MTNEEAIIYWQFRYDNTKDYRDPHWDAQERREHREYVEALQTAIQALKQTAWIPVDDMLPDSHSPVLISGKNIHLGVYGVDIARYNGGMWQYDGFTFPDIKVLAWMPLPKPYKEGTDAQDKTDRDPEEDPGDLHGSG